MHSLGMEKYLLMHSLGMEKYLLMQYLVMDIYLLMQYLVMDIYLLMHMFDYSGMLFFYKHTVYIDILVYSETGN